MELLAQVSDNAERTATHLLALARACETLEAAMHRTGRLLLALRPYTPASMRGELFQAAHGLYNGCEQMADTAGQLASDYRECLLLAQAGAARLVCDGKELR